MFKLNEIKELIELVDKTSIHELELENEGYKLSIRKPGKPEVIQAQLPVVQAAPISMAPAPGLSAPAGVESHVAAAPVAEPDAGLHKILSPMVGTFYRASSPDANAFVNIGDKVGPKTTVCIIEAMKLMNELEAEVKGEIKEILVENGQLVEFGQPLFLVKPE
ncbi:acetyl-CoA carboxylase biotin carboxyl carrier protein [Paenibacillus brevis]|uniref:Biotin carboxyl carrier protein of acetyl-CoA carboxylase n=1 Tax=Paenibacillus brevis TaxID=2841508 RepID=A0ABS6FSL7_9BACL|nr:acetyl-CoA carboxylase biotin carboxyl carrier protein [Paenibacillus brevis]MBU5672964.1 acetyl-CoA carboxylase biotin carboxyl carrier protein [Paenibacillus brevis]